MKRLMHFRPREAFGDVVELRFGGCDAASILVGPGATAVGWIPYHNSPQSLPQHLGQRWEESQALRMVLASGNRQPPETYSGPQDLMRDLDLDDFRGAIGLDALTLYVDGNGEPVLLQFMPMARVGCTAVRLGRWVKWSGGTGSASGVVDMVDGAIDVTLFVRFKIDLKGQIAARFITGNWPPNATMTISYRIDLARKHADISFGSTMVPSMTGYLDWHRRVEHRIETLDWLEFRGFVESGGCQDALGRPPVVIRFPLREYRAESLVSWTEERTKRKSEG